MHALENRIPPPLVATFFGAAMWLLAPYVPGLVIADSVRIAMAFAMTALGAFFCLAGVVSFHRAKTTVNPLKPATASALVSSGIYQYSRNPMYLGFALSLVALAAYLASPVALLGALGFVLYLNRFQIAPEERVLTRLFGAEFQAYQARVRRWL